jgi:hypothetical protein
MMNPIPKPKMHTSLNGILVATRGNTNNLIGDSWRKLNCIEQPVRSGGLINYKFL